VDVHDPQTEHVPVLACELMELAAAEPGDTVVDGTFGAGGHARLLAARIGPSGTYVGIDRDPTAVARFERFAAEQAGDPAATAEAPASSSGPRDAGPHTRFVRDTFPAAFLLLAQEGVSADVVILDIGVSSMHIDDPARGFSYMHDGPLDMRMDPSGGESASELLARADQAAIARMLREFSEEPHAGRIARAIVERREHGEPVRTTAELAQLVHDSVPHAARSGRGHPAKRTFQALRVAVNDELGMLDRGLDLAWELLRDGGRLVVISFHSLEDRMVKRRMASWLGRCTCPPGLPVCACGAHAKVTQLTRKAVKAHPNEIAANPRAASARLRAVRKVGVASP
jgi:16S rRNA (cytosine1402-N4)-methyltransferase